MFGTKKHELIIDNLKLENRIHELEEILCPNQQHSYLVVEEEEVRPFMDDHFDRFKLRTLQCKRCKHIREDDNRSGMFSVKIFVPTGTD